MFLDSGGDTLYYIRRVDGHDSLFAHQPDHVRGDHHTLLQSTPGRLMAWAGVATAAIRAIEATTTAAADRSRRKGAKRMAACYS